MFVRESIIQPTIRHRESGFTPANVRPPFAVEDRKADADTHLAVARSQNTGTGILGVTERKRAARCESPLSFLEFLPNLITFGLIQISAGIIPVTFKKS